MKYCISNHIKPNNVHVVNCQRLMLLESKKKTTWQNSINNHPRCCHKWIVKIIPKWQVRIAGFAISFKFHGVPFVNLVNVTTTAMERATMYWSNGGRDHGQGTMQRTSSGRLTAYTTHACLKIKDIMFSTCFHWILSLSIEIFTERSSYVCEFCVL